MRFPPYNRFLKMLPQEWSEIIDGELSPGYYRELHSFLRGEYSSGTVYPPADRIFRAFELTPPRSLKAVIIGQDPYHGEGEADGLAFSSSGSGKVPPSLRNIFREVESDLKITLTREGDLSPWAKQGVLLLNTFLTVRGDIPGSHKNSPWEEFTGAVIQGISSDLESIVFMLWGNHARSKGKLIDISKHLVLEAPHPSPFSAGNGFFGCRHFSGANDYIVSRNKERINWYC